MCGVVLVLSYPVLLAFHCFLYPITYLHVAAAGFVLELPRLMYLVLPEFEHFALRYLIFAVFKPSLLVLGFLVYVSLSILVFKCWVSGGWWWVASYLILALLYPLLLCILLLLFCLPFSRFLLLLHSPLLLLCSPLSLLFSILSWF